MNSKIQSLTISFVLILSLNIFSQAQVISEAEYKEIETIKEKTKELNE